MNIPLFRFFPLIYGALLAVFALIWGFNGLYGQDAHEYLRQSQVIFSRWQGQPLPVASIGDAAFGGGYPLLAALLRWVVGNPVLALQMANGLAAVACLALFVAVLTLLSHGARNESRWAYALLGMAISPAFVRAGLVSMSDAAGLAFAMAAFYGALKSLDDARSRMGIWAIVFCGLGGQHSLCTGGLDAAFSAVPMGHDVPKAAMGHGDDGCSGWFAGGFATFLAKNGHERCAFGPLAAARMVVAAFFSTGI
jgi:hypothetical protein